VQGNQIVNAGPRRYTPAGKKTRECDQEAGWLTRQVLEKGKLVYLLQVMAPLAFLPWRRPVGLLFTVPGFFFCLLAHRESFYSISFQYTTHMKRGIFDTKYILYKLQGLKKERKRFRKALASGDFGVVHWKGPFVLAERGAATDRNDRLLRRLKR
jgi:hypothetical protein